MSANLEEQKRKVASMSSEDFNKAYNDGSIFKMDSDEEENNNEEVSNQEETTNENEEIGDNDETEEKEISSNNEEVDEENKPAPKNEPIELDYKALYEEAIAPFKANGQMITVKDIPELKKMASLGIDYTKKLQELKPQRKLLESLKDKNFLSEDKINLAIDLLSGDRKAITQHLKTLGIDPYDIDIDSDTEYSPTNHIIDDTVFENREYVNELLLDPNGKEVINAVLDTWDNASISNINKNIHYLNGLTQHHKDGIFQQVTAEITKQKSLGNLRNMTYEEAYATIATQLLGTSSSKEPSQENKVIIKEKPKEPNKKTLENTDQIKALSTTKTAPTKNKSVPSQEDIGKLSKEDFNKFYASYFKEKKG